MVHASREESEEYSSNNEKVQLAQRPVHAACEASGLGGAINNPFLLTPVSAYLPRQRGTFVTIHEAQLTRDTHPKSTVYLGLAPGGVHAVRATQTSS